MNDFFKKDGNQKVYHVELASLERFQCLFVPRPAKTSLVQFGLKPVAVATRLTSP